MTDEKKLEHAGGSCECEKCQDKAEKLADAASILDVGFGEGMLVFKATGIQAIFPQESTTDFKTSHMTEFALAVANLARDKSFRKMVIAVYTAGSPEELLKDILGNVDEKRTEH